MLKILKEGGNVFPDVTPFDHKIVGDIVKQINSVLDTTGAKAIPIGSTATPTPGKQSGDMDIIVDQDALAQFFKNDDAKTLRKDLRSLFDKAGLQTAQSGVSVHVRVPVGNAAHQVDVMVVPQAEIVSKYHIHTIPKGSPYKGLNKQLAMANLAKKKNMLWSAFQGLFGRNEAGKKGEFITSNIDEIAKLLIGPNASGKDLGSLESIMQALPKKEADQLLADLKADPSWKEFPSKESLADRQLNRIREITARLVQ